MYAKTVFSWFRCLTALVLLAAVSAFLCNSEGNSSSDELQRLEAEILDLIGDAEATNASYCRVIAFGSKPCGGPWRYLVYSAEATDSTLLHAKVDRYNRLQADLNREQGLVSDCSLAAEPTVSFADGLCRAGD